VTKYNPAYRRQGAYTRDDWTSVSDIGRAFDGVVLTKAEYKRVENAYVASTVAFLREAGVRFLTVVGLENHEKRPLPFSEDSVLDATEAADVVRRMLRNEFWCRLEGADSFIHVGYDYYMYVGVPVNCPHSVAMARQIGLFVEPFRSPYGTQAEPCGEREPPTTRDQKS
jgi:hypothetical protein